MSRPKVYLAGPIGTLSYDDATAWRNQAQQALAEAGIAAYSPMRDKEFLAGEIELKSVDGAYNHTLSTSRAIMTRDHLDCTTADAILVNYVGFDGVSIGTIMEQAFAFEAGIPVVVIADPSYAALRHPMLAETVDFRARTLDEGLRIIKSLLLAGGGYE